MYTDKVLASKLVWIMFFWLDFWWKHFLRISLFCLGWTWHYFEKESSLISHILYLFINSLQKIFTPGKILCFLVYFCFIVTLGLGRDIGHILFVLEKRRFSINLSFCILITWGISVLLCLLDCSYDQILDCWQGQAWSAWDGRVQMIGVKDK